MTEERERSVDALAGRLKKFPFVINTMEEKTVIYLEENNAEVHIDSSGFYHLKMNGYWRNSVGLHELLELI